MLEKDNIWEKYNLFWLCDIFSYNSPTFTKKHENNFNLHVQTLRSFVHRTPSTPHFGTQFSQEYHRSYMFLSLIIIIILCSLNSRKENDFELTDSLLDPSLLVDERFSLHDAEKGDMFSLSATQLDTRWQKGNPNSTSSLVVLLV